MRALIALVATSLLALAIAGCSRPSAARLNADGNRAYARGDYPAALEDYRKAQVERPDLTMLNYNAGNVLHQQGDYQRAIGESQRATRGGDIDTRSRALYSIGSDYFRQGKLKEALEAFKNALRLDPSDLDAKYNVEVIQRRLDQQAQQQKQQDQSQANQQGQQPQQPQQSQSQRGGQQGQQQSQQSQQGNQQGQQGQQGNQQGQQQGQQGQQAQGQPGGQSQQGQQSGGQQQATPPFGQPNQSVQSGGANGQQQAAGPSQPGSQASPSVRQQQAQLNQDLQNAIDAYQKQATIEDALRILDVLAEQERIAQAAQGNRSDPRSGDK